MNRLKILHINTERTFRGGEIQTLLLVSELHKRGHENLLVVQQGSALHDRARQLPVHLRALRMRGEMDLMAVARLRSICVEFAPDLLHAHTSHAASLALLSARKKVPVIVSRRVLFPLRKNPLSRWKYKQVDAILAVSQSIVDQLIKLGTAPQKLYVAESGTDFALLDGAPSRESARFGLSIPPEAFVIGNVSFFDKHKGQSRLIEAFAEFAATNPNCYLLLVGDGPLLEHCRLIAKRLPVADRILFTGQRFDTAALYAAMDLVFLSSIPPAMEGWSGTLREAMGFGLLVIAVRQPAIEEQVRHEETGILVSTKKEEWVEAMRRLHMDALLRKRIAEEGKKDARRYTAEALADKTEACYLAVLSRK